MNSENSSLRNLCMKYSIYTKKCIKWIENTINSHHSSQEHQYPKGPLPELPASLVWRFITSLFCADAAIHVCNLRILLYSACFGTSHKWLLYCFFRVLLLWKSRHSLVSGWSSFHHSSIPLRITTYHICFVLCVVLRTSTPVPAPDVPCAAL